MYVSYQTYLTCYFPSIIYSHNSVQLQATDFVEVLILYECNIYPFTDKCYNKTNNSYLHYCLYHYTASLSLSMSSNTDSPLLLILTIFALLLSTLSFSIFRSSGFIYVSSYSYSVVISQFFGNPQ